MENDEEVPANNILFGDFCKLLEQLQKKRQNKIGQGVKQEQTKILVNFINDFRVNAGKICGKKDCSFFPVLRLLLPERDRQRCAYNLKQSKLKDLLVKALGLNERSSDAQKLLNFRSVEGSHDGDFPGVAYFVLKNRISRTTSQKTIGEINEILDKIANAEVGNKRPIQDEALSHAINNLTAEQSKWFLRLILKDLKIRMGMYRILAAFHPDAPDLFDKCSDLTKVCEELGEGNTRPVELGVQLFYAISPMLLERLDVTKISQLPAKSYMIEEKFDGERFQMHMDNGVFEYYSKKGHTYSDKYGKTYDSGILTPFLKDCFAPSVTSFILDGEMMGWHKKYQCFGSKGQAFDIKTVTENCAYRPCFRAFDVLYYNGKSLVGPPDKGGICLKERMKRLDTMFSDVIGVIMKSQRKVTADNGDILDALNKAIEDQDEGIVIKDVDSYYIPNRRNAAGWYKIKPEYTKGAMEDLDLIVIGADEGESKKQGRAKSFHVACLEVLPDETSRWLCIGRVSTGLKFEERQQICSKLEKHWVPTKREQPPSALIFNKEKPDFWIQPQHSMVLQVRATELIRAKNFGTSHTLRFPRIVRIREDKPIKDVLSLDEFNNLVSDNKGSVVKMGTKRINPDQIEDGVQPIRKRTSKVLVVADQFRTRPTSEVEVVSKALLGRKLRVLTEDEDCKKAELVRIIESHSGKHVENCGPDTWCCVAGKRTHYVRQLIETKTLDIISTAWLRSLPPSESLCSLDPIDMLSIKPETRLELSRYFDIYGDSYTEEIDTDRLKRCFDTMDDYDPDAVLTKQEMLVIDKLLWGTTNRFSYLRPCCIHFINPNSVLAIKSRLYGATECDIKFEGLTHIVVPKLMKTEDKKILREGTKAFVVTEKWLEMCFAERRLVSESEM